MEYSGTMSDVQTAPETVGETETAGETTAKPAPAELPREEPAAIARAETPAEAPPVAESSAPPANTAAAPETGVAPETTAAPEKVEHGIGVLLVNLGTPDAPDAKAVRRYLKQFLTDPRVIEKRGLSLEAHPQRRHPADPVAAQGARLQAHLEQRQERIAVQDHHPLAGRKARRHPGAARQARHRRLGDALCQSVDRLAARSADRARLRPHPGDAALSAIRGRDHGDGRRRGVPLSDGAAPAAGAAHPAGLLRRSLLHRGARLVAQSRAQGVAVCSPT